MWGGEDPLTLHWLPLQRWDPTSWHVAQPRESQDLETRRQSPRGGSHLEGGIRSPVKQKELRALSLCMFH